MEIKVAKQLIRNSFSLLVTRLTLTRKLASQRQKRSQPPNKENVRPETLSFKFTSKREKLSLVLHCKQFKSPSIPSILALLHVSHVG